MAEGIRVSPGALLEADIIMTATGFQTASRPAESCPWWMGAEVTIHDQFVLLSER